MIQHSDIEFSYANSTFHAIVRVESYPAGGGSLTEPPLNPPEYELLIESLTMELNINTKTHYIELSQETINILEQSNNFMDKLLEEL